MINKAGITNSQSALTRKAVKAKDQGSTIDTKDKVQMSNDKTAEDVEQRSMKSKLGRMVRKNIARAAGVVSGVVGIARKMPVGFAQGVEKALHPEHDVATRKKKFSRLSVMSGVAVGSAVGAAAFGPVGLVLGATGGYITSVIGNFLDNKSGMLDSFINNVDKKVDEQIDKLPKKEESSSLRKAINAGVAGALEGAADGWEKGKVIGSGVAAGLMSGASFIANDLKETVPDVKQEIKQTQKEKDKHGIIGKGVRIGMGLMSGAAGVMMNVPGGAIEGSLEAVEVGFHRKEITRPLLLFATNAGKVLPTALVGAALGGPVGAAVGTAVGLITGSLTTLIDGKYGFNRGIIRKIDRAIGEVVEDSSGKGYAIYHNAAKGALVGSYAGLKEGWSLGYKGGSEIVDGIFETPLEAAKHEEEPKKNPHKQLEFDFMMDTRKEIDEANNQEQVNK